MVVRIFHFVIFSVLLVGPCSLDSNYICGWIYVDGLCASNIRKYQSKFSLSLSLLLLWRFLALEARLFSFPCLVRMPSSFENLYISDFEENM